MKTKPQAAKTAKLRHFPNREYVVLSSYEDGILNGATYSDLKDAESAAETHILETMYMEDMDDAEVVVCELVPLLKLTPEIGVTKENLPGVGR